MKVGIVGTGFVGATAGYALVIGAVLDSLIPATYYSFSVGAFVSQCRGLPI